MPSDKEARTRGQGSHRPSLQRPSRCH
jgi:hypothetical protein